jgi:hypothetical protein
MSAMEQALAGLDEDAYQAAAFAPTRAARA